MLRHLLKLVWNRKRTSALLIAEIFFSFLVTFAVATMGLYVWDNYRRPVGFDYRGVWDVSMSAPKTPMPPRPSQVSQTPQSSQTPRPSQVPQPPQTSQAPQAPQPAPDTGGGLDPAATHTQAALLKEVQALPQVEAAAALGVVPYGSSTDVTTRDFPHGTVSIEYSKVSVDGDRVLHPRLVAGRWFQKADEALTWRPGVVNQDLARAVFGAEDAVGQRLWAGKPKQGPEVRVIGVVGDYRKSGELSGRRNSLFLLGPVDDPKGDLYSDFVVRLRPGTPAAFEEELVKRLQAVAPQWSFVVKPLSEMRRRSFRLRLTPLLVGGVLAASLLAMVALGLTGVVWQNLLQRTRELGLRRAAGASRAQVRRQVIVEQLLLASLGLGLALALVAQIPLLHLVDFVPGRVLVGGAALGLVVIVLLVVLCALYPSGLASRVPPAEALRDE